MVTKVFKEFFSSEKAGGMILLMVTAFSLLLANSPISEYYLHIWEFHMGPHTAGEWINDGLMAIFFLLIGLELKREVQEGELKSFKKASLPIIAAFGGMIVPATIYLFLNNGTPTASGAGIPMATDIAFAIGVLSLLGKRVPLSLKIFLTALAVIDDLGAVVVIAVFYTAKISFYNLSISLLIYFALFIFKYFNIRNGLLYILGGIAMWYFMLNSGVHATIAGVLLAFVIPEKSTSRRKSLSKQFEHFLHKPVTFLILPLFAMSNTGIVIESGMHKELLNASSLGIILGLLIGKPVGISLFSYIAVKSGVSNLPSKVSWGNIVGVGVLGGIGFTMSIFITLLAFDKIEFETNAKLAILIGSLLSGTIGYIWLKTMFKKQTKKSRKVSKFHFNKHHK
ncbi:MAG: Na+/H+ antiporter NhaA [Paludibacteraceae bacterium]|nr:Na+/H+ antiporter NhaA [Paludibacteraceae bacterium]